MPRSRYTRTNLREVMAERGQRYDWLARRMGYTRQYVYLVLGGKRALSDEFVRRACDVLGLPESALFFNHEPILSRNTISTSGSREAA